MYIIITLYVYLVQLYKIMFMFITLSAPLIVPSAPPKDIKAWKTSSTSLIATWEVVPERYRHGNVLKYVVRWRSAHGKIESQKTHGRSLSLTGLRKFTEYSVNVSAVTRVGAGPASIPVTVQTDEDGTPFVHSLVYCSVEFTFFVALPVTFGCSLKVMPQPQGKKWAGEGGEHL